MGEALLDSAPIEDAPSVLDTAPPLIRKLWRKLNAAMASLDESSPDHLLHEARILAKRFRYSVEFVTPVYGPLAKEVSAATAKLQDVLGLHQDCAVAKQLATEKLAACGNELPPQTCFELGRLVCHADAVKHEQRMLAGPTFEALRSGPWPLLKEQMAVQAPEEPLKRQED
jgi:CHAD domain-containing protein